MTEHDALRDAALGVVLAQEAVRNALNGFGHPGDDHDQVLWQRMPGEIQVYETVGDCAACGGSQYGREDDLNRAYGRLRSVLGLEVRAWEQP